MEKDAIRDNMASMESPANAIEVGGHIYHAVTSMQTINGRRAYLHVYYDKERTTKEHDRLLHKVIRLEAGLMNRTVSGNSWNWLDILSS